MSEGEAYKAARIRFGGVIQWAALALIVAVIWAQTIPPSRYEPFQKLDWEKIASAIVERSGADDLVVTTEGWSTASVETMRAQTADS